MTTKDGRDQIGRFQDAVAELVDQYLKDGLDPDAVQMVLDDEADGVVNRHRELQNKEKK